MLNVIKIRGQKWSTIENQKLLDDLRALLRKRNQLQANADELQAKIDSLKQQAEDMHTTQMKKFKVVLQNTEDARSNVKSERDRDGERLEEAEEELEQADIKIEFLEKEQQLKLLQVDELTSRIEMLEKDIAEFETKNRVCYGIKQPCKHISFVCGNITVMQRQGAGPA